jgi:hypothetical protein
VFLLFQSSPEYSSAALDTVAQLIALLFALLDQELAPFSRRPQVHADFCRRLLKNLYELDYDVCRTLLRCALVPDASYVSSLCVSFLHSSVLILSIALEQNPGTQSIGC